MSEPNHSIIADAREVSAIVAYTAQCSDTVSVVLAERHEGARREYVTWLWSENGGLFWGHYYSTREAAFEDFRERFEREAVR